MGQYMVEFSDVSGWTKPDNQAVTINKGQTTTATGTYTPSAERFSASDNQSPDCYYCWGTVASCRHEFMARQWKHGDRYARGSTHRRVQ